MNRTQHHEKAEQLLSEAGKEADSFRRSQILAEAQVHATLALSAEPAPGEPGRGHLETPDIAGAETLAPSGLTPYGTGEPTRPRYSPLPPPTDPGLPDRPPLRPPLKPPSDWV